MIYSPVEVSEASSWFNVDEKIAIKVDDLDSQGHKIAKGKMGIVKTER